MKLNGDKCHLLAGGYKQESIWGKTCDTRIWESSKQKNILRLHIHRSSVFWTNPGHFFTHTLLTF